MDNVKYIKLAGDTMFAVGKDNSLQICGYNNVTIDNGKISSVNYIDKNKILDNVKWIDEKSGFVYAMTYNGELYRFLVNDNFGDRKVKFTEPYKINYQK